MPKVDSGAIAGIARKPKGLVVTFIVNWLLKTAKGYAAGLISLAAAPCTAMVFVWSNPTEGVPACAHVQVAVNDLIMPVAFTPIVMFLSGVAHVVVPAMVLICDSADGRVVDAGSPAP